MVSKLPAFDKIPIAGFRAVLFRMVSKQYGIVNATDKGFRAVLFRMVSKLGKFYNTSS